MMDRKKIIEEYIFEGSPEERIEKFEIAWDVWKKFGEIKNELSTNNVFKPLANKIEEELLEEPFVITQLNWCSLYIAKPDWKQNENDRGIYAICIEKWDKNWPTIGIVRNTPFTTEAEKQIKDILSKQSLRFTKDYLGYIPIPDWKYGNNDKDYYQAVLLNLSEIVDFFFNYFKQVYEIVRKAPGLEQLLDRSVEERKAQIQK